MTTLVTAPGTGLTAETALDSLVRTVCVISAVHAHDVHAMTVDSLSALCSEPPRVVVAVRPASRWWRLAARSGRFGVSVLADDQLEIARWFASRRRGVGLQQFREISSHPGPRSGAPLIDRARTTFECEVTDCVQAVDQVIVVAELLGVVSDAAEHGRTSLLRVGRDYRSLGIP